MTFKVGTRASELALTQTKNALDRLGELFPELAFDMVSFSTPGDRDKLFDLRSAPGNFFSKDLDDAVASEEIDCAIHSAKDLSYPLDDAFDWFWLPWREDPRDALILRGGESFESLPENFTVAVSSDRRVDYAANRFPNAEFKPVRGDIGERMAQLDSGKFDMLIMAVAALNRLGLTDRITEFIAPDELPSPAGQGALALSFRKNDTVFTEIRKLFVKSAVFAGAGCGVPELTTLATVDALKHCDVCLYDALCDISLLDYLPQSSEALFVGKRSGCHSMRQDEICAIIAERVRRGEKVVRLKGGDPGVFGRLAEEIEVLDELKLPYRVVPGISSLSAATTATGLLLTRRGHSRGFTVATPRKSRTAKFAWTSEEERLAFPTAFFMGVSEIARIAESLMGEGRERDEPAAVIFSAGRNDQNIVCASLADIAKKAALERQGDQPGILLVGENANPAHLFQNHGALHGDRVLLTCSENVMESAVREVRGFGGVPVSCPMVELTPLPLSKGLLRILPFFDWVAITSPAGVAFFMKSLKKAGFDLRRLPKIMVCGPETAARFAEHGVFPDGVAESDFGNAGMLELMRNQLKADDKLLLLRSNLAKDADSIFSDIGFPVHVDVRTLYLNKPAVIAETPRFDSVVFASASAVDAFVSNFGVPALRGKKIAAIGHPTAEAIRRVIPDCRLSIAKSATIASTVEALAVSVMRRTLVD
jgi:uroporphyrinogen III methyltransferase/synthase